MEKPRILVIDDEVTIHKTFQKALKNEGYDILFAANGEAGLEMVRQAAPNLIFLDLRMPVMDGFAFLDRLAIKPTDPFLVVVITGHGEDEEVGKSYERGVNFFLRKPLSMTEICGLARRCIEIKQIEREIRAHRDNLEQLVAERTQTILEQLHFQQTLLDSIPTPVFFKDPNLVYLGCNSSFAKVMHRRQKRITGRTDHELVNKRLAELHRKQDRLVLKKGPQAYEISMEGANKGNRVDLMVYKATFKNAAGRVGGLIGTMFDITSRKAAEQEIKARSAKLAEANTALRVVLDQIGSTKLEVERKVLRNVKELILPDLEQLKLRTTSPRNREDIETVKANLAKLTNTPTQRLTATYLNMSPREIQICDLIRLGKSNKAIGMLLNVSKSAIEFHRNNLRDKLGLKHKRVNLRSYLMNME